MWTQSAAVVLTLFAASCIAGLDLAYGDDLDLTNFVSRPELKVPLFNISILEESNVSPGYLFVAPYGNIKEQRHPNKFYQPCQAGPAIYDQRGNLVWTGSCEVRNRNTCDFRAWSFNNTFYLSGIHMKTPWDWSGHGFIMDNSYNVIERIRVPPPIQQMNMHEFNLLDDGRTALHVINKPITVDLTDLDMDVDSGWILDMGFREVDITTGETLFEWWAVDEKHVKVKESQVVPHNMDGPPPMSWDFLYVHGNAVDKDDVGDYLFNGRHTDTIYKISGKDGSVLWRLGGINSTFVLEPGFNFSRQHDTRFHGRKGSKEFISFLDNAADLDNKTSEHSSALLVELDHAAKPPVARVLQRIVRPDGKLTRSRGNYQRLPNGNSFVGWSDNAYISEHAPDGTLLMQGSFQSRRFTTYRAYKANFTGVPTDPPAISASAYGATQAKGVTVAHVSWNGATEVALWRFFGFNGNEYVDLGEKKKVGFETMFQADGYFAVVFAEAVATNGSSLGTTELETVAAPDDWAVAAAEQQTPMQPADTLLDEIEEETSLLRHGDQLPMQQLNIAASGIHLDSTTLGFFALSALLLVVSYAVRRSMLRGRSLSRLRNGIGEKVVRSLSPPS